MTPWPGGPPASCAAPTPRSSLSCAVPWPTPGGCPAGWGRCAGRAGPRAPPAQAVVPGPAGPPPPPLSAGPGGGRGALTFQDVAVNPQTPADHGAVPDVGPPPGPYHGFSSPERGRIGRDHGEIR